jgi:hypothetical protein
MVLLCAVPLALLARTLRHRCALMRLVAAEATKVVCYLCLPRIGMREVEFVYAEGLAITAENRK